MADTMLMNEYTCNVVYVDKDAVGANDGSTPADALTAFPAIGALANNTVYLVRRSTTTGLSLPDGSRSDLENVFFVGMPLNTDWIYPRVPAAAKAAWDADVPTHARVEFATYNSYMLFRPIIHAGVHRLHVVRMNPSGGNAFQLRGSSDWDVRHACIHFQDTSAGYQGNYFFTNNKWTDDGIDLSDPGYTTNATTSGADIALRKAKYVVFRDNEIQIVNNATANSAEWGQCAIQIDLVDTLDVCDNTLWIASTGYAYANYVRRGMYLSSNQGRVNVLNNTVNLVAQNSGTVWFAVPIEITNFLSGTIKDLTVSMNRYYNVGAIVTSCHMVYYGARIYSAKPSLSNQYNKITVKNIDVDLDKIWFIDSGSDYAMLSMELGASGGYPVAYTMDVSDLSAQCVDSSGLLTAGGTAMYLRLPREANTVSGITAYHYTKAGLILATPTASGYLPGGAVMKQVAVKGTVAIAGYPFVEITSISSPKINETLVTVDSSVVYINTTTFDRVSWGTTPWLVYLRNYSLYPQVFIDNSSLPVYLTWTATAEEGGGVYMNNVGDVAGNWYGSAYYYQGTTHSTYRQGGGNASIKMLGAISDSRKPLRIGPNNFTGLQWTPPATGSGYAKFYIAHVNTLLAYYQPAEYDIKMVSKRIVGEVLVPYLDGDNVLQHRVYSSTLAGIWETDLSSTWKPSIGEPGYEDIIQRVCTIPFVVLTSDYPVQFRLRYDLYGVLQVNAYTYLDPIIVFAMD